MLAPALAELTQHVWDQGNEHFQPTTFQISNLNAGTGAPNVIPGELKARFNLRYSPVQTQETLRKTVEEILDRHGVRYTIEWYVSGEPFYTPPGALSEAVCAAVKSVTGTAPQLSTGGGTSDGRFIATLGAQVVELGVTNASIHKVNESVGSRGDRRAAPAVPGIPAPPARLARGSTRTPAIPSSAATRINTHAGIDKPEEGPVDLRAFAGAGQHLAHDFHDRKHVEHVVQR